MKSIYAEEIVMSLRELYNLQPISNKMVLEALYNQFGKLNYEVCLEAFTRLTFAKEKVFSIQDAVKVFMDYYADVDEEFDLKRRQQQEIFKLKDVSRKAFIEPDVVDITRNANNPARPFPVVTEGRPLESRAFGMFCQLRLLGYIKFNKAKVPEYSGFFANSSTFLPFKDIIMKEIKGKKLVSLKKVAAKVQKEIDNYEKINIKA